MRRVEFVWRRGCPNVAQTRANLMRAFSGAGVRARWEEWCADEPECPERLRALGSPVVLIDGQQVGGALEGAQGDSCRVYAAEGGGLSGVLGAPAIEAALRAVERRAVGDQGASSDQGAAVGRGLGVAQSAAIAQGPAVDQGASGGGGFSWKVMAGSAPGFAVALLPKVACPACWPAYVGALGGLGLPFLIDEGTLLALTAGFLALALFFLGFRARRRWGLGPLGLGAAASAALLVGKFYFESDPAMFAGVGLLMVASLWNAWPRRAVASGCAACPPGAGLSSPPSCRNTP